MALESLEPEVAAESPARAGRHASAPNVRGTRHHVGVHLKSLTLKGFKSFPDRTKLEFGDGRVGHRRAQRLRQVQHHRRRAVGDGRAVAARRARPVDAGRHLRRRPRGAGALVGRGRVGVGQLRRRRSTCRWARSRSCAAWIATATASTGSTARAAGWSTCSRCSPTRAWARSRTPSSPRAASRRSSPPSRKDRRLLIEEAAGLGKHRKRRRRAQLKLERTQDNLDRALDVEREARSRLRPLKRQAEAAELHERLERQTIEARWELARDDRARAPGRAGRGAGDRDVGQGRARGGPGRAARGRRAPRSWPRRRWRSAPSSVRRWPGAWSGARSAAERDRAAAGAHARDGRAGRRARRAPRAPAGRAARCRPPRTQPDENGLRAHRVAGGAAQGARRRTARARWSASWRRWRSSASLRRRASRSCAAVVDAKRAALRRGRRGVRAGPPGAPGGRDARPRPRAARRPSVGAELARANQFLRSHGRRRPAARASLSDDLEVEAGCELALVGRARCAAAAAVVEDRAAGGALLDRAERDGGRALVAGARRRRRRRARDRAARSRRAALLRPRPRPRARARARPPPARRRLARRRRSTTSRTPSPASPSRAPAAPGSARRASCSQAAEGGAERVLASATSATR